MWAYTKRKNHVPRKPITRFDTSAPTILRNTAARCLKKYCVQLVTMYSMPVYQWCSSPYFMVRSLYIVEGLFISFDSAGIYIVLIPFSSHILLYEVFFDVQVQTADYHLQERWTKVTDESYLALCDALSVFSVICVLGSGGGKVNGEDPRLLHRSTAARCARPTLCRTM